MQLKTREKRKIPAPSGNQLSVIQHEHKLYIHKFATIWSKTLISIPSRHCVHQINYGEKGPNATKFF
jgi:hypothetical protein